MPTFGEKLVVNIFQNEQGEKAIEFMASVTLHLHNLEVTQLIDP